MKIEKSEYVTLDTGTYTATVASIYPAEGKFGPQLEWKFALDPEGAMKAWTSQAYSPKSKLFAWARAILGEAPETLDTDDLIGKPVRLSVLTKTHDDGSEYNKVDAVLAPRAGQKAKPLPEADELGEEVPF